MCVTNGNTQSVRVGGRGSVAYATICLCMQRYAYVCKDMLMHAKICLRMQRYVSKDMCYSCWIHVHVSCVVDCPDIRDINTQNIYTKY